MVVKSIRPRLRRMSVCTVIATIAAEIVALTLPLHAAGQQVASPVAQSPATSDSITLADPTPLRVAQVTPGAAVANGGLRPRIGLVLSGGGARGAAHVGVLKVLEELRIPIDAVAGTSMGAVVGGLYASGLSAREVEDTLLSLDWQESFSDQSPRRALGFRRKQDDRNFLVRYALGIDSDGFKLPKGLIQGQKLAQVLRAATLPVIEVDDFDRLPIPFRAVATDLETGAEVVMGSGDLVTAMRASMSAPGVFVPTEREGRLLADGGMVHNLPIAVAQQMNVDMLIVVDVSFPLYTRDELTSPIEMTLQGSAIMIRSRTLEERSKLTERDIVIDPQLGTYGSVDFTRVEQVRALGEDAARAMIPRLRQYSLDQAGYQSYLAGRSPRVTEPRVISFVRTDAAGGRYQQMVSDVMRDVVGKPLDKYFVESRLKELYAIDLFESVDYTVVEDGPRTGLEFHLRRKSWGPTYVRFGLNIEDNFEGNSRYNVAARFIATELNSLNGEWLTDLQVGDNPRFYTEFYQPLGYGHRYFVSPHIDLSVRNVEVHDENDRVTEYRVRENAVGFDVGRELGNWGEWRVGVFRGSESSRVRVGDPTLPETNFSSGGYFGRISYDTLDSIYFPREGAQYTIEWNGQRESVGSDRVSDRVLAGATIAQSFGKSTIIVAANVGATLNTETFPQDYFQLGGFLNLSGLGTGEISGPHYGIGRVMYYRKIGSGGSNALDVPLYAGVSLEAGNVWQQKRDMSVNDLRKNIGVFLGADTILGPVYLGAGADEHGESAFYLYLGRTF
ncbi:MAG TPA: patatin-like phospholipase family protein [Steroidobacteraceae bacterium]|nr:patatin-like phospholipase family protein [Steroidobacteraceae bacterium]